MNSAQITFDSKAILNIAAMKGGEVSLSKGEVVSGTVQQVNDNGLIVINIKGKNIEAVSEVPVQEGQKLYLSVDDVRGGKTYLKVMTPEALEKMESANLEANLRNMNIVANDASVQLARKLIQYQLPVTEKNLGELSRMINQLGGRNAQNLEIAAYALSRGINADAASLKALQQFISQKSVNLLEFINLVAALPEDSGADALNILRNAVLALTDGSADQVPATIARATPITTPATAATASAAATASVLPTQTGAVPGMTAGMEAVASREGSPLPAALLSTSQGEGNAAAAGVVLTSGTNGSLANAADMDSTGQTASTGNPPASGQETARPVSMAPGAVIIDGENAAVPAGSPDKAAAAATGSTVPAAAPTNENGGEPVSLAAPATAAPADRSIAGNADRLLLDLSRALSDRATVRMDQDSSIIASDLRERIMGEKELLRGLAVLKQLAGDESAIDRQPLARDILRTIEGMERDLSGQRLFNFSSRSGGDVTPSVYYFSIPVKYDDQYRMMQLRLSGEGGRRSLADPDHLSIAVSLDTENLGIVLYHLDWFKKGDLNIQGLVQDQDIADYMGSEMERLVGSLAAMGYNVNNLGIRVSQTALEAEELKPQLVQTSETAKPFGIDIRA